MAIYHLTAKTVSRGESASAAVRCDYIERAGRYRSDEAEVLHKGHGHMPAWAENCARNYWAAADAHERANGRLFKQLEFALPKELSPQQQTELAAFFCMDLARTKDGPLPYSFAVHKGRDKANPHCHLLISERVNDGHSREPDLWFKRAAKDLAKGGAKKTKELHPREWLLSCRELWAERANLALQRAGHDARIDHRTLEAQGINRAPTIHLGPSVAAMERKGIRTQRGSRLARASIVAQVEKHPPSVAPEIKEPAPIPAPAPPPTTDECRETLLAIAKQGPAVMEQ
ncbi:MAG: MobA/MobL family protein, partial [Desulfovibrionaceae bacterium]|nr:MobA/MobL family protein [Desulfovibrionaceae bacterium]